MPPLSDFIAQGGASLLFVPAAVLLGAFHGLEPGHSKTMMAAFIVAVGGTVKQAVLLGIAATLSHTAVVWLVVLAGMFLFSGFDAEASEPYFQVASAALIIGIAVWMLYRTWREQQTGKAASLVGAHAALACPGMRQVDTGHGRVGLELARVDSVGAARWHVRRLSGHRWNADDLAIAVTYRDGRCKTFTMVQRDGFAESVDPVPEPHVFTAIVTFNHAGHGHSHEVDFTGRDQARVDAAGAEPLDAHSRSHGDEIKKRFAGRRVTTRQIVLFGLTGGLIPCPAAITVLLLCLQVKQVAIGATLVLAFSVGLALTMVTAGVIASLSVTHLAKRWSGFGALSSRAPYFSSIVIICMGLYIGAEGLRALAAAGAI